MKKMTVRKMLENIVVEDWLNAYPREILGFRSADEVFAEGLAALG